MNTNNKKRNVVEWAMHYRQIIILVVCCLVAFGIYSLPEMRKNEFPDFTIRQGIVVAAAPGNTAGEMLEQVAKPLEEYIFSYKEVRKEKTFSKSRDGIVYIQVQLNDEVNNKDEFWSKFRHGVSDFKSQLPSNVLALQVIDDFGDTSALLITMESEDKTYRELDDYMDDLKDRLRQIPAIGRMSTSGMQREQISVYIDNARLSKYGLSRARHWLCHCCKKASQPREDASRPTNTCIPFMWISRSIRFSMCSSRLSTPMRKATISA